MIAYKIAKSNHPFMPRANSSLWVWLGRKPGDLDAHNGRPIYYIGQT